jgi:hypothetical protein
MVLNFFGADCWFFLVTHLVLAMSMSGYTLPLGSNGERLSELFRQVSDSKYVA